jgi:hypothetical protein
LVIIVVIIVVAVTALKIGDILTYSSVPFVLYIVYRLISRFTIYKALFTLIAVLIVRGVILLVRRVVSLVSVERFSLWFLFTVYYN